ncbi:MAG: hypothetical protein IRZ13_10545 [Acetobacteraceae bacterium]|nr:hypothetical protein [Acetobacteraceae bacterium]
MFEHAHASRLSGIAVLALGLAAMGGPTGAQAPEPGFRGPERNAIGNVVGGGVATILGGGDDMAIVYSGGGAGAGAVPGQPPRAAALTGGAGEGPELQYLQPETARPGRGAWIVGDGEDLHVVYTSPYAAPMR